MPIHPTSGKGDSPKFVVFSIRLQSYAMGSASRRRFPMLLSLCGAGDLTPPPPFCPKESRIRPFE
jgi:hypothetical protein